MGLFVAFIDLTKAFDTVSREGLWKILARLGCPPKFLTILRHRPDQGLWYSKQGGSVENPGASWLPSKVPHHSPPSTWPRTLIQWAGRVCGKSWRFLAALQSSSPFSAIDLTKDFDTVSREGPWKILALLGCPPKFLTILCHRPDQGLWYSKQGGSVENPGASWLPSKVPHHSPPATRRSDGPG